MYVSINSIEVRIHLDYKFNLRLSNFITNSSILNISLEIEIYFKFLSPIYFELYYDVIRPRLLTAFSVMQHAVKSSPMDVGVKEYFWGKNCSPCVGVTCQGTHFEFIPTTKYIILIYYIFVNNKSLFTGNRNNRDILI